MKVNAAREAAIKFFKRNPEAKVAHVVLDKVFANAKLASNVKKSLNAKHVTVIMRDECIDELTNKTSPAEQVTEE